MAVRFIRNGTASSIKIVDHNELLNRGVRPHSDIDSYLDEMDSARGLDVSIGAVLDKIRASVQAEVTARGEADTALNTAIEAVAGDLSTLEETVAAQGTELAKKYEKPAEGIPETDLSEALQERINSPQVGQEVIDARTDKDGQAYPTLKARLDDMEEKVGSGGSSSAPKFYLESLPGTRTDARVFTVPKYKMGDHSLEVYVDGARLTVNKDYTETDETTVTFLYDVSHEALVLFTAGGGTSPEPKIHYESLPYTRTDARVINVPEYVMGDHSLEVYVDGARVSQDRDYEETTPTSITFLYDVKPEALVLCTVGSAHGGYSIPEEGIPKEDLSLPVQEALDKVNVVEQAAANAAGRAEAAHTRIDNLQNDYKQITKLGITATQQAPYVVDAVIAATMDFKRPAPTVLRFVEADDLVRTECAFDNADASSFITDEQVLFDGKMHLDLAPKPMVDGGALGAGKLWTLTVTRSKTKKIEGVV